MLQTILADMGYLNLYMSVYIYIRATNVNENVEGMALFPTEIKL